MRGCYNPLYVRMNAKGMVSRMKAKGIPTMKGANALIAFATAMLVAMLLMLPATAFAASGTEEDPITIKLGVVTDVPDTGYVYYSFTPEKDGEYTILGRSTGFYPGLDDVGTTTYLFAGEPYVFDVSYTHQIKIIAEGRLYAVGDSSRNGQYLTWGFDAKTGTLTIGKGVGDGDMGDTFSYRVNGYPWYPIEGKIKHVVIGEGVTTVAPKAFFARRSNSEGGTAYAQLTDVSFPSTLKQIGDEAFYECPALKTATFPASLESIGQDAFVRCPALESITFKGPTAIGVESFRDCKALENVTVHPGMTEFDQFAFYGTPWVLSLAAKNKGAAVVNGVLIGAYQAYDKKPGDGILVIPDGVTKISPWALWSTSDASTPSEQGSQHDWYLEEVIIPDSVTEIGEYAFYNCAKLERVTIGNGVTEIPKGCFENDREMRTVKFGKNIKTIGDWAFKNTWLSGDLVIPDSVVSIGKEAFQNWDYRFSNSWVEGNFDDLYGDKEYKPKDLEDRHITMGANLKEIGKDAFDGWTDGYKETTVTIHAYDGTYAQEWAGEQGFGVESRGAAPESLGAAWTRLAGNSALDTMSAIVDAGKFAKGGTVVLASLEGYWDALTAAGIAGLEKAPVLMVLQDSVSSQTTAQLKKLAPTKIIVCGGTYWIPDKVVNAAKAAAGTNPTVVRLAGSNAAITAEKIAAAGKGKWFDTAIVATAGTFQDALAAAPVAYANKMPIFLAQYDFNAERGYITRETINAMLSAGIEKCYIAGGTYWLPGDVTYQLENSGITVIDQLGGETAVETSGMIADLAVSKFGMSAEGMGAANVAQHYDALASAAFCGKNGSVLVLVRDPQSSVIGGFVKDHKDSMTRGYVFGGTGSVSDASMKALQAATK